MKWVKFGVSGHFPKNAWRKWPEILQADVSWPPSELISSGSLSVEFVILALFWLSEMGQIWGFRAFWLPAWWALWLLWWPLTDAAMFQCVYGYLQSVFFFLVLFHCCILLEIKLTTTTTISWRTHGGNGLKFCMLIYLDHLQNWSVYGYGLVIFPILVLFWLSEAGQIWGFQAFSGKPKGEMAWNFARWWVSTTFTTD